MEDRAAPPPPRAATPPTDRWREALAQLTREFEALLPQRLARAAELLHACEGAECDDGALAELQRIMHTLAGSAATFGRAGLGDAAKALELHLVELRAGGDGKPSAHARALLARVEEAAAPA